VDFEMNEEFRNYDVQPINIQRTNPLGLIFLLDQSGSMADPLGGHEGMTKAQALADAVNRFLQELDVTCTKPEGIRDYVYLTIIGYGGEHAPDSVKFLLTGGENGKNVPISWIHSNSLRTEKRNKKVPDGAGGLVEVETDFTVWFDPVADGGTPMGKALRMAKDTAEKWVNSHPDCLPPIVFNFTDGESTDGDPEPVAEEIRQLSNQFENVLLFNLHLSKVNVTPISFPNGEDNLPDEFAKKLFRMSSVIPRYMIKRAKDPNGFALHLPDDARGFVLNEATALISLISFLSIGGALLFLDKI
jgi:uncharacterized protein YegL